MKKSMLVLTGVAVLAGHPGALVVANKSDLPAAWDESGLGALAVSAERGDGVEALIGAVAGRLVPEAPPPGSGVPFRPAQVRRLAAIRDRLASGDRDRAARSIGRWVGSRNVHRPPPAVGRGEAGTPGGG